MTNITAAARRLYEAVETAMIEFDAEVDCASNPIGAFARPFADLGAAVFKLEKTVRAAEIKEPTEDEIHADTQTEDGAGFVPMTADDAGHIRRG